MTDKFHTTVWYETLFEADLRNSAVVVWMGNGANGYKTLGTMRMTKEEGIDFKNQSVGKEKTEAIRAGVRSVWSTTQPEG